MSMSGTSGGVWGLERGYCMMIGGDKAVVDRLDPIFASLAPGRGGIPGTPSRDGRDPRVEQGYLHAGPVGSGHFVKMVHNGIEYGLMQAFAEGFDILKNANTDALPEHHRFKLDLADIAEVWRRGSVISSWLLDLTASALARSETLEAYSGFVADSGEGRWTVNAAIDEAVPAEVLTAALFARFRSRQQHTFAEKILSAMREGFGGHKEPEKPIHPQRGGPRVDDGRKQQAAQPGAMLLRHFWCHRRSHPSPGHSGTLQSCRIRLAAGAVLPRRYRPQADVGRRSSAKPDGGFEEACHAAGQNRNCRQGA